MLTLKKISFNNSLSQETMCFSAEVYWDSRFIGFAENRGNGGETWVRNYGERKNATAGADLAAAEAWVKTQPLLDECGEQTSFGGTPDFHDLPSYVDSLVADWDIRRTYKRSLTRKLKAETWFVPQDGRVLVIKRAMSDAVSAYVKNNHPGAVILNSLPIEDAITMCIKDEQARMRVERDKKGSN